MVKTRGKKLIEKMTDMSDNKQMHKDARERRQRRGALPLILATLLLVGLLSGCGFEEQESEASGESTQPTLEADGFYVPVAEFQPAGYDGLFGELAGENYSWHGDFVLYMETEWLTDVQERQRTIYRQPLDGVSDREVVVQEEPGEQMFDVFFGDVYGNLYILGREKGEEPRYFYSKLDPEGNEIFTTYPEEFPTITDNLVWGHGLADSAGNGCISDGHSGRLLFFDAKGSFLGQQFSPVSHGIFVDAGEEGVYIWEGEWDLTGATVQKLNLEQGTLEPSQLLTFGDVVGNAENYTLLGGGEGGLLLSTTSALFQYDVASEEALEILRWDDPHVNIDGSQVEQLWEVNLTDQGAPEFQALLLPMNSDTGELARISWQDEASIPEKQQLTLGVSTWEMTIVQRAVRRFNRQSQEYFIEMIPYTTDELTDALMYGKGDIPDILDAGMINLYLLETKGLLADLEPYFEESQVVGKEDILDRVWETGYTDGHMVRAVICYSINALATSAENMKEPGWTVEEMLSLQQEYPKSKLMDIYEPSTIFSMVIGSQLDSYLDWETGQASFDTPEFAELLERVANQYYPEDAAPQIGMTIYLDEQTKRFLDHEFLLRSDSLTAPYFYQKNRDEYGDAVTMVGYPSVDGEPLYRLSPQYEFSIYGESRCKDGAWAFIEFMLSYQEQSWYAGDGTYVGFPARKDAFEEYITKPYRRDGMLLSDERPNEQYQEELRFMAEHMEINQMSDLTGPIYRILSEETGAFFAGDKTAQETADIIQNRVQLYLDEQ